MKPRGGNLLRWLIYMQVAWVAFVGGVVRRWDGKTMNSVGESLFELVGLLSLLTLWVLPIVVLVVLCRSNLSMSKSLALMTVEAGIVYAHLIALLPAVQ